jgi:tetratricopeptide (TPR) repeat protein
MILDLTFPILISDNNNTHRILKSRLIPFTDIIAVKCKYQYQGYISQLVPIRETMSAESNDFNGKFRVNSSHAEEPDMEVTGELLKKAEDFMESGQFLQALQCCEEILGKDDTCEQAWDIKAEALDNLGMFEEAVECYSKALNVHQNSETFDIDELSEYQQISVKDVITKIEEKEKEGKETYDKGEALVKEQRYEEGIDYMDEAAVINPEQEMKYKQGALLALKESTRPRRRAIKPHMTEDLKIDLDYYNKILSGDPDNERAWNNKGTVMLKAENAPAALECFNRALALRPHYVNAWVGKGASERSLGEYLTALESFDRALELQPHNISALFAKGSVHLDMNNAEEALTHFDMAVELNPEYAEAWFERGNALYNMSEMEDAVESYARALDLDSDDADAWFQKGNALYRIDRFTQAIKSYDNALRVNPRDSGALFQAGNAFYALGTYDKALEYYDKALELRPDDENILNNKAVALRKLKRYEEALSCCDKLLGNHPNNSRFQFNRDKTQEAMNNKGQRTGK